MSINVNGFKVNVAKYVDHSIEVPNAPKEFVEWGGTLIITVNNDVIKLSSKTRKCFSNKIKILFNSDNDKEYEMFVVGTNKSYRGVLSGHYDKLSFTPDTDFDKDNGYIAVVQLIT